jgi:hypothetical protein
MSGESIKRSRERQSESDRSARRRRSSVLGIAVFILFANGTKAIAQEIPDECLVGGGGVPTLSTWGKLGIFMMIAGLGAAVLARRRTPLDGLQQAATGEGTELMRGGLTRRYQSRPGPRTIVIAAALFVLSGLFNASAAHDGLAETCAIQPASATQPTMHFASGFGDDVNNPTDTNGSMAAVGGTTWHCWGGTGDSGPTLQATITRVSGTCLNMTGTGYFTSSTHLSHYFTFVGVKGVLDLSLDFPARRSVAKGSLELTPPCSGTQQCKNKTAQDFTVTAGKVALSYVPG